MSGQLNHSLILHDPLGHRAGVRVTDRNHLNDVVISLLGLAVPTLGVVLILAGRIVPDDSLEQFEFLLHGVMDTGLNGSHGLQGSFQNCQGCTHGGLGTHIADLHVRDGTQSASLFCDLIEQSQEGCTWLLIGERHDVVFDGPAGHIHIPEFTWGDWGVITLDPHATGLQSTGQVGQSPRIHQLANQRSTCTGVTADHMDQSHPIETKPWDITVVHEMLALGFLVIVFQPISINRQNIPGSPVNGYHIRQGDTGRLPVFVHILKPFNVQVGVDLKDLVAVVIGGFVALLFGLLLLNVRHYVDGISHIYIPVEPADLKLLDLILGLTHDMGDPFCVV